MERFSDRRKWQGTTRTINSWIPWHLRGSSTRHRHKYPRSTGFDKHERRPNDRIGAHAQVRHFDNAAILNICKSYFRKPNDKLRLLVGLLKINALISDDYINNIHSVSTLSDEAQHLAGKKLFCKLYCSQAYQWLQMADQRSIEMLAFNYASRAFAYKRLAQGLNRALFAFSSFLREYLDKVIKDDQCAQYVDGIWIAANYVTQLIRNIRAVFEWIRKAGPKLTLEKCLFGVTEVEFHGRTITPQGIAPKTTKSNYFSQIGDSQSRKTSTKIYWVRQLLPQPHSASVRKTIWILWFFESRQTSQSEGRSARHLQSDQSSTSGSMRIGAQTTNQRTPIPPNDGCQLSRLRLCAYDRRRQWEKTQSEKENFRTSCIRIESVFPCPAKNVNLMQKVLSDIPGISRIQPYLVGNNSTNSLTTCR